MTDEEKRYEKEQWKKMKAGQKLRHFLDYYLIETLVAAGIIIFLAVVLKTVLSPREVNLLTINVFDDVIEPERADEYGQELKNVFGSTGKHESVTITSGHSINNMQDLLVLQVHAASREADVIVGSEETVRKLAGIGYLEDFEEVFGDEASELPASRLFRANGPKETSPGEEISDEEFEGKGEEKVYGLKLKGSHIWESLTVSGKSDYVAACAAGTQNPENILEFFRDILRDA